MILELDIQRSYVRAIQLRAQGAPRSTLDFQDQFTVYSKKMFDVVSDLVGIFSHFFLFFFCLNSRHSSLTLERQKRLENGRDRVHFSFVVKVSRLSGISFDTSPVPLPIATYDAIREFRFLPSGSL